MRAVTRLAALSIATVFGVGYAPAAPGTWGTIAAIPIYLLLSTLETPLYFAVLGAIALAGVWAAKAAGEAFGEIDHRRIVIDEVTGYLLAMSLWTPSPAAVGTGFVLFRFFDIAKPFPAGLIDRRLKNALGVMLDDLVAGAYALAGVASLRYLFPAYF
ncbi:MAG: phosphatidylglycerophosphatase A [Deltaproteobacteria bacterium]|nr:phosphatidylglycerophosphatase A [Deltaproteobacteria bacterium]